MDKRSLLLSTAGQDAHGRLLVRVATTDGMAIVVDVAELHGACDLIKSREKTGVRLSANHLQEVGFAAVAMPELEVIQ